MFFRLRLQHLRADSSGEFIADYYADCRKTTLSIQQFRSPNTPEQNGVGERDENMIIGMVLCLLNGAALPKSVWGEIVATTVFLLNPLPNKIIDGDMPH